ncbi:MAG: HAMP domain-containing protein [Candidatus Dormibacteraeota bacterium]|nr:HAMP domain-containing protein [Candidatus Dormibacteraeota bacterium]
MRLRLLLAAVGIVAVSLILSGGLTWAFVSRLEEQTAKDQLAKNALLIRPQIVGLDCVSRVSNRCIQTVGSEDEFAAVVNARFASLNLDGARLVLLDQVRNAARRPMGEPYVIYDSQSQLGAGEKIPLGAETVVAGQRVREGTVKLSDRSYLLVAAQTQNRFATWILLVRPTEDVTAQTTQQLLPRLLLAGAVGLLVALLATVLLGRMFTRPLRELQAGAEAITAGDYGRRVDVAGRDEIGLLGRSFNRMAEAVERSRALQRDFLANVSHELKTPLTSLIGFSQALTDGSLSSERDKQRAAAILHEEAQRVLRLSQELLDLARAESRQMSLQTTAVDLAGQLQQEIELVRQRAHERELTLELSLPGDLPPALADPERLHQIFDNLLDNAVKYAPAGTAVRVRAGWSPGLVTVAVNNRVGPHRPDPARMFERFYRADPSRASAAGGVGLGLAISRELARVQGGDLSSELADDGQLTLTLTLPSPPPPAVPRALATRQAPLVNQAVRPPSG